MKRMLWIASLFVLAAGAADLEAQQREIQGTVVAAREGRPLPGVTVQVVGMQIGTLTDATGNFAVSVPRQPVRLRASMIGFRTREIDVPADLGTVRIELEIDVLNLEGLVATGQATTVARRNLANAVATVPGTDLQGVPAQTVDQALQGRVAGANIQANSGAPGGGVQVQLRGVSSINASSEPLWIVDGVVMSNVAIASGANAVTRASSGSNASNQDGPVNRIADLNPEDIERIEILKGASAAAIYGARASNGVILVTTRRGTQGAPRVSVTQRFGQYRLSNSLGMRSWTREDAVAAFGPGAAEFFNADGTPRNVYDHERLLAGEADLSTETSVTVNGGVANTQYFISGSTQGHAGIIQNTGFDRQSLRLNLDQRLGSRVKVGLSNNVVHSVARRGLTNNDNTGTSFWMVFPFTPNFIDLRRQGDGTFPVNSFERSNPFQTAALMDNTETVWRNFATGHVTVDLLEQEDQNLRFLATGGADYFQQRNDLFFPPELQFEPLDQQPGTALLGLSENVHLTGNVNLVHTFRPTAGALEATTSAGLQYEDRDLNTARTIARNLIGGQRSVSAGASPPEVFQNRQRVRDVGIYVQSEVLTLGERMLLTGSLRGDRSSANGDPDRFHYYPKAAVSYRIPTLLGPMDELKLRLAYGETGNQPLFGQKFTSLDPTQNIQGLPGLVVFPVAGDPDIRPERTREIEGGFDLTLGNSAAVLEVTGYTQSVSDLLLQRTVAPSSGFTAQIFNGGGMQVRGVELALNATPVRSSALTWVSRTTFAANRSKITDLPVPSFRTGGFGTALGAFQIEEGRSATQIVANVIEDGEVVVRPVGDANPDFRMAFQNELQFGRVALTGLVDWQQGGNVINLTKLLFDFGQNTADYLADPEPGVDPQTGQPILDGNGNQITTTRGQRRIIGFGRETRPYIEDASFVKVREITLSYILPPAFVGRLPGGVDNARISLSGRNLLTFTGYTGLDPEVSNFGNQSIARNIDVAPFPPSRSFWLTFNVGF